MLTMTMRPTATLKLVMVRMMRMTTIFYAFRWIIRVEVLIKLVVLRIKSWS